jgi:RNA exonuclease 4
MSVVNPNNKQQQEHHTRDEDSSISGQKYLHCDLSIDTCSTSSLSDHSSTTPPPRRRRRLRGKKKAKKSSSSSGSCGTQQSYSTSTTSSSSSSSSSIDYPDETWHNHHLLRHTHVALDCEMVQVVGGNSAVARVTVVDGCGTVVLDEYCLPTAPITDYRTAISGISEHDMCGAKHPKSVDTLREMVRGLLHDKILIGHGLKNDLKALGLAHKWHDVRDTAKYEPYMKQCGTTGTFGPRKLKELALQYLHRPIQTPGAPHCPVQDATAALDLYWLARAKWEKCIDYKIKKTAEIELRQAAAAISAP